MLVNSSTNNSFHLHSSSTNSSFPSFLHCFFTTPSSFIFTFFSITYAFLLLPLCVFVLYRVLQEWWKKPSNSLAPTMSHSDIFTFHLALLDLIGAFGGLVSCCGIYVEDLNILSWGILFASFILNGESFFHILTCVERYLAVVHPITYLRLRNERGIRIRNISIGCVWLLCFVAMGFLKIENIFSSMDLCFLIIAITTMSFCSLSVLCVLIRPGPGEQGGVRERVDQSKKRAFHTIVIILGVLVMRFAWGLARAIIFLSDGSNYCVIMTSGFWFYLPSSLVLPLLFVHRTEKIVCCKNSI